MAQNNMASPAMTLVGQEASVYATYRSWLKSPQVRKLQRAASRRQEARTLVARQFAIGVSEVKAIIAKGDEINGVRHDHDPNYLARMEMKAALPVSA